MGIIKNIGFSSVGQMLKMDKGSYSEVVIKQYELREAIRKSPERLGSTFNRSDDLNKSIVPLLFGLVFFIDIGKTLREPGLEFSVNRSSGLNSAAAIRSRIWSEEML